MPLPQPWAWMVEDWQDGDTEEMTIHEVEKHMVDEYSKDTIEEGDEEGEMDADDASPVEEKTNF